jgi:mannosyltransferase
MCALKFWVYLRVCYKGRVETGRLDRRDVVLVAGIVLVAAVLRFSHIGQESFWLDEGVSAGIARLPWADFFKVLWRREGNMALYYLLLRGWMFLGSSEAWLRGLSALLSVATVPFIYLIGRNVRSRMSGIVAALLFAVSLFAVSYAQEARSYSLVCFLVTAATWFLLKRNWKLWAITIVLAVYAHLFATLVLAAHLLYMVITRVEFAECRRTLAKLALALVPAAAFVVLKSAGQLNWIPSLSVSRVKEVFGEFAGGGDLALIVLFLAVIAAMLTWSSPVKGNRTLLLWMWLMVPVGVIVLVSVVHPLLMARFLMISLPALLLVAGIALAEVPRPVAALLLVAIVFFGVRTDVLAGRVQAKDDWRAATAYVLSKSSSQDGIIFHQALGRQPFEYYAARQRATNVPGLMSPSHGPRLTYRDFEMDKEADVVAKLQSGPPVWWVVLNRNEAKGVPDERTEFLLRGVAQQGYRCQDQAFRGVMVMRCGRRA